MERTFEHFPQDKTFEHFPQDSDIRCPICGTNDDRECFLLPIDGTGEGSICEVQPTHVSCVELHKFRYNKEHGLIYCKL